MYKYFMAIDGEIYNAIFCSHDEVARFLDENEKDGSEAIVFGYVEVTTKDILEDDEFDKVYRIEMAAESLMPDIGKFYNVYQLEAFLLRLGYV